MSVLPILAPSDGTDLACEIRHGCDAARPVQAELAPRGPVADGAVLAAMTGGIAHDLRTILAIISAGAALAERHLHEPEQLRTCLAGMKDGVQRGLELVSRLLGFVAGRQLEPQPHDLNALLRQLQAFLEYGAGPDVRLVMDLAPSLPECLIDAGQFDAAVLNLVVNARDAMARGGVIEIGTSVEIEPPSGDAPARLLIHLTVKDHGQGMSPRVLRKVFQPYFTTKGTAGTGLGVPQVCAFVQRAGGHIDVRSARGAGTMFDLVLPALASPVPTSSSVRRQLDRRPGEGAAGHGPPFAPAGGANTPAAATPARPQENGAAPAGARAAVPAPTQPLRRTRGSFEERPMTGA